MENQKVTDQGIHFPYKSGSTLQQVAQQLQNYIQSNPENANLPIKFIEEGSEGGQNHSAKSIEQENQLKEEQSVVATLREEGEDD
jgi:hypothetical protein